MLKLEVCNDDMHTFVFTAIDLINNLLQVKMRKRYSVDKSLSHVYLQVAHKNYSYAHTNTHTDFSPLK